jgi:hypothetical protein
MTHHRPHDSDPAWIDARADDDTVSEPPRIEAIADSESNTVTFAPERRESDELTMAWMTVPADMVVEVADMR